MDSEIAEATEENLKFTAFIKVFKNITIPLKKDSKTILILL